MAPATSDLAVAHTDATKRLAEAIYSIESAHPNVKFEQVAYPGVPAQILPAQAASSGALVVGTTGHRGFDCGAWARCPTQSSVTRPAR